jgi:hypothetical protein
MAILTVSRQFGSGGRELGRRVADDLGYVYVDRESILEGIRAAGEKWEKWGKELDEHCPTIWEKYDWSFRGFGALLQSAVLKHAADDRVVIIGMGANFLLKGIPHVLTIHAVGPLDLRIQRVMARDAVDRKTAQWLIEKKDGERSCFIRSLYSKHWEDFEEYDLILDMGFQTLEEATARVKAILLEKERSGSEEARQLVRMRAAAAKVKAGLCVNPSLQASTLDVVYDGECVVLRGIVHSPKERTRIEEAAAGLAAELPLKSELHYRV